MNNNFRFWHGKNRRDNPETDKTSEQLFLVFYFLISTTLPSVEFLMQHMIFTQAH